MSSTVKEFKKLILQGKKEEAQKYLPQVYKKLDKMAKVDFIKRGRAKRLKSKLTKKLAVKSAGPQSQNR